MLESSRCRNKGNKKLIWVIKHVKKLICPLKRPVFGIYDPLGVKKLFQLRIGLSQLKKHKYDHKFKDTPSSYCNCGKIEDTRHFMLECPLYSTHREELRRNLNLILLTNNINPETRDLLKICLYGDSGLSKDDNVKILKGSISYIISTNRFS